MWNSVESKVITHGMCDLFFWYRSMCISDFFCFLSSHFPQYFLTSCLIMCMWLWDLSSDKNSYTRCFFKTSDYLRWQFFMPIALKNTSCFPDMTTTVQFKKGKVSVGESKISFLTSRSGICCLHMLPDLHDLILCLATWRICYFWQCLWSNSWLVEVPAMDTYPWVGGLRVL